MGKTPRQLAHRETDQVIGNGVNRQTKGESTEILLLINFNITYYISPLGGYVILNDWSTGAAGIEPAARCLEGSYSIR